MGEIEAIGKIARAWKAGMPRRRRAATFLLAAVALSTLAGSWIVGALFLH